MSRPREAAGDPGPPQRLSAERGQAAVELALALPVVFLVLMALLQTALIARDQVQVTHAAREAAREAAVSDNRAAPRRAAEARSSLDPDRLSVEVSGQRAGSRRVQAQVRYRVPTRVPIVGVLVPDVVLKAHASMRREGL